MKPDPKPLGSGYCSLGRTWIEAESFAYNGGTRRAFVRVGDGTLRIVRAGIPDTFFSIPATYRRRLNGKRATVRGFVSSGEEEFRFTEYTGK